MVSLRQRLAGLFFPALLVPAQLFLLGPWAVFSGNREEFVDGFLHLAGLGAVLAVASCALLIGFGALLPRRLLEAYTALLTAVGGLCWAQGNWLLADYGRFDGAGIDWGRNAARAPWELALWGAGILLALVFHRRLARAAPMVAAGILTVLTLSAVGAGFFETEARPARTGKGARGDRPGRLFQLSAERNVLHIVLDGFQSTYFGRLAESETTQFDRLFDGFVFYPDHLGAFPTTRFSIPAMLSGLAYRNRQPAEAFLTEALDRRSMLGVLDEAGWEVGLYTITQPFARGPARRARVIHEGSIFDEDRRRWSASAELVDISLFRHAPHFLKPAIYNQQKWRLQPLFDRGHQRFKIVSSNAFLENLAAKLEVGRKRPVYKFIHVGGPHQPVVVDAECGFIGPRELTDDNYLAQARCSLRPLESLFHRLRELRAWDDSLILITSDHGMPLSPIADRPFGRIIGLAMPLLLVKVPGATGGLSASAAPSAVTDIPATVLDILGIAHELPGRSVLRLEPLAARDRSFGYYLWDHDDWTSPFMSALHVLDVRGPVLDPGSWSLAETVLGPDVDAEEAERHREIGRHLGR